MVLTGRSRLQRGETLARMPLAGSGRVSLLPLAVGVAVGAGLLVGVDDWADALITSFALAIIVASVVVVAGYAGQLSLCQFALAGVGAWVAARLMSANGWPFELAWLTAVVVTDARRHRRRPPGGADPGHQPRRRHARTGADVQLAHLHQQRGDRRGARPADRRCLGLRPRPRSRRPPASATAGSCSSCSCSWGWWWPTSAEAGSVLACWRCGATSAPPPRSASASSGPSSTPSPSRPPSRPSAGCSCRCGRRTSASGSTASSARCCSCSTR